MKLAKDIFSQAGQVRECTGKSSGQEQMLSVKRTRLPNGKRDLTIELALKVFA